MKSRGQTTRRAVLRAAETVFAERGYAGARMDEVAEKVGIKRASMVYYFRDKRSLYEALLDDLFADLLRGYEAILAGPGPGGDRILKCMDRWVEQIVERPGLLRITLWELARGARSRATSLASRIGPLTRALSEAIAAGQREGVFRAVDATGFVMTVAGASAFMTLGQSLLGADGGAGITPDDLRLELRNLAARVLFVD